MVNNFIISISDQKYRVKLNDSHLIIDGKNISTKIEKLSDSTFNVKLNNKNSNICFTKIANGQYHFLLNGNYYDISIQTELEENTQKILSNKSAVKKHSILRSPMPGMILKVNKKNGDKVDIGDSLVILEAMKMENDIKANKKGIIKEILVKEGTSIEKNDTLIIFE